MGGMGPDASARLYQRMIELVQLTFGITSNEEYPEIIIDSIPVPDFISEMSAAETALKMLKKRVRSLTGLQPYVFAIACNTVHIYLDQLQSETIVPFMSLITKVAQAADKKKFRKVGILASPSTLRFELYQKELQLLGIGTVLPNTEQTDSLGKIIHQIVSGNKKNAAECLTEIAKNLVEKGADAIILGCTELPLVFPVNFQVPVLSSVEVLAESLLQKYYQKI